MYFKNGKLSKDSESGKPIIQNTGGQSYEVSFIAAFVWERLDGTTPLSDIKEEMTRTGDITLEKLGEVVELNLAEMEKVQLVYQGD